jgi:Zn-dependent peptidase ImmA (M78 family)
MNVTLEPRILRWARERAGLDESALAKKLGTKPERVTAWEETGEVPYKKAELLAQKTYTPFGYLFLKEPPEETLPIPDFRTLGSAPMRRPSPNLLDTIYRAQHRQNWFRDYLVEEGQEALGWVGSLRSSDNPVEAAGRVCTATGLTTALRQSAANWEDALRLMVEQIEESGVLVMRNGIVDNNVHRKLSVDEFRGFALADEYAPLIFVNGADSLGAQMFTLAHELIHIWLGLSGVSTLEATFANGRDPERFCNEVAAELLVPLAELRNLWPEADRREEPVQWLVRQFRVSGLVILRRMLDAGVIDRNTFTRLYRDEEDRFRSIRAQRPPGGDFYRTMGTRAGKRFASALIANTLEGRTTFREALRLLGMKKIETFNQFARELKFSV